MARNQNEEKQQSSIEKVVEAIKEKDHFGAEVKWYVNGESEIKNCPSGCLSLCFMLIFWLMTITAVLEYGMMANFTITKQNIP